MTETDKTLRERITVQQVQADGETGDWAWRSLIRCSAAVQPSGKRALYSPLASAATGVTVRLRHDARLDYTMSILWGEFRLLPVTIVPEDANYDVIQCAAVEAAACRMDESGVTFPGVVGEKYVGHSQETPMAVKKTTLILTVPKPITLDCGSLVEVSGVLYTVLTDHELGEGRNEYEIGRTEDL